MGTIRIADSLKLMKHRNTQNDFSNISVTDKDDTLKMTNANVIFVAGYLAEIYDEKNSYSL